MLTEQSDELRSEEDHEYVDALEKVLFVLLGKKKVRRREWLVRSREILPPEPHDGYRLSREEGETQVCAGGAD